MGEETTPKPCHYEQLILIKDKKEKPTLADAYKNAVMSIPSLLNTPETKQYSFGKKRLLIGRIVFKVTYSNNIC